MYSLHFIFVGIISLQMACPSTEERMLVLDAKQPHVHQDLRPQGELPSLPDLPEVGPQLMPLMHSVQMIQRGEVVALGDELEHQLLVVPTSILRRANSALPIANPNWLLLHPITGQQHEIVPPSDLGEILQILVSSSSHHILVLHQDRSISHVLGPKKDIFYLTQLSLERPKEQMQEATDEFAPIIHTLTIKKQTDVLASSKESTILQVHMAEAKEGKIVLLCTTVQQDLQIHWLNEDLSPWISWSLDEQSQPPTSGIFLPKEPLYLAPDTNTQAIFLLASFTAEESFDTQALQEPTLQWMLMKFTPEHLLASMDVTSWLEGAIPSALSSSNHKMAILGNRLDTHQGLWRTSLLQLREDPTTGTFNKINDTQYMLSPLGEQAMDLLPLPHDRWLLTAQLLDAMKGTNPVPAQSGSLVAVIAQEGHMEHVEFTAHPQEDHTFVTSRLLHSPQQDAIIWTRFSWFMDAQDDVLFRTWTMDYSPLKLHLQAKLFFQ